MEDDEVMSSNESEPEAPLSRDEELVEAAEESEYFALEDLEDDEEEFIDGVTIGQLKEWKAKYGRLYTATVFADMTVIFRPINRMEYTQHVKRMEDLNNRANLSPAMASLRHEESLASIAMLHPVYDVQDPQNLAGLPSLIAQNILEGSGFSALAVREL